jgi:Skp family chaperone for outer membrane proteins
MILSVFKSWTVTVRGFVAAVLFAQPFSSAASAQEVVTQSVDAPVIASAILTIDKDRFFRLSAFGQRVRREFEASGRALEAENREIEASLQEEEQALTAQRSQLPADEFRALADGFDLKVQDIRRQQSAKRQVITVQLELAERRFLEAALPILQQVMTEKGATLIVEKQSVFMSSSSIDITDQAIERINRMLADDAPPKATTNAEAD